MTEVAALTLPREAADLQPDRLLRFYDVALAEGGSPFWDESTGTRRLVVAQYQQVVDVLSDPDTFGNSSGPYGGGALAPHFALDPEEQGKLIELVMQIPPTTAAGDGQLHAKGRDALTGTLPMTAGSVHQKLGGIVQRRVDEFIHKLPEATATPASTRLLGEAATSAVVDILPETWELPLDVAMDIIGFPDTPELRQALKEGSQDQIALIWAKLNKTEQARCIAGFKYLWEQSQKAVKDHAGVNTETPDMIEKLLKYVTEDGQTLTEDEAASIAANLAVAGHETTANAMANSLEYVLSNPELKQFIIDNANNPRVISAVARELLRLWPPIIGWSRRVLKDGMVGDVPVKEGDNVFVLLGAANRDPRRFADPHEFKLGRTGNDTTFGHAVPKRPLDGHYCPGAQLAQYELAAYLVALLNRYPNIELATNKSLPREFNIGFHAVTALPVILEPSSR
jgi:cytochrome P450